MEYATVVLRLQSENGEELSIPYATTMSAMQTAADAYQKLGKAVRMTLLPKKNETDELVLMEHADIVAFISRSHLGMNLT